VTVRLDGLRRGVAQPGRAPGSGPGGRRFKSSLPDHLVFNEIQSSTHQELSWGSHKGLRFISLKIRPDALSAPLSFFSSSALTTSKRTPPRLIRLAVTDLRVIALRPLLNEHPSASSGWSASCESCGNPTSSAIQDPWQPS
jgi:hypothetical protein